MPLREKGGTYPSRYDGLIYYLDTRTEDELVLGFAETEEIIGRPLPTTAYTNADYWTKPQNVFVQRWGALGWQARLDRRNRCVLFVRDAEEG